jgi:hypothetical protein
LETINDVEIDEAIEKIRRFEYEAMEPDKDGVEKPKKQKLALSNGRIRGIKERLRAR